MRQKIVEAHANVKDLNLLEAKVNFIKAWQSLPDYGVSLFVVRFHGEKKDELLGVASNKIMRMSLNNGDHLKTWRFSTMKVCIVSFFGFGFPEEEPGTCTSLVASNIVALILLKTSLSIQLRAG